MQVVLRLLCLASIITGGIKAKTLENIKREFLQVRIFSVLSKICPEHDQAYGYNLLPLLLSLSSPPLAILLPNPLPTTAPPSVAASKYPYTSLRKSLRLLIEDPDPMEELENDISYVYSGFAPISVRLVQCIAQKGGVLSNPADSKEKDKTGEDADGRNGKSTKFQAHPIVGWKGFEDVAAGIPGETVDIVQKVPGSVDGSVPAVSTLSTSIVVYCELTR